MPCRSVAPAQTILIHTHRNDRLSPFYHVRYLEVTYLLRLPPKVDKYLPKYCRYLLIYTVQVINDVDAGGRKCDKKRTFANNSTALPQYYGKYFAFVAGAEESVLEPST